MIRLLVFVMAILLVLNGNVCPLFAKAPTTPKIVFTSSRADGNVRDIYIMDTDGHNQVNLTDHHADDLEPVWSPTGEHILFVSDRAGVPDLYLMEPMEAMSVASSRKTHFVKHRSGHQTANRLCTYTTVFS